MMTDSSDMFGDDDDGDDLPWDDDAPEDQPSAAELEEAGQESMFGAPDPAPTPAPVVSAQPYRVLARKYRSQTFAELIGQDAMVQTLANAIKRDRLAHAFLMTGIRGVGKTSTARLIAKALNCVGVDGKGGPTISPCGVCEPCVAIAEGRHIDVIEMDAASHTGVDDVREIIEAVRYAAVSARYKIYIIDEVHMLSRNAFNALLKTLEEPPAHVKFLFATTEVDKLPITVLSRCQRFDLKRIPAKLLAEHFGAICEKEGVAIEAEALGMIAEAAEGSARDGLSILDQAIAHADLASDSDHTHVTAESVREMLGLADKSVQRKLFAALLNGDGGALLDLVSAQFALGVEPIALMRSAMEITHRITVAQVGRGEVKAVSEDERKAIEDWAKRLQPGQLHRLWQMLIKGHDEVKTAPAPLVAAEMALLRCLHAADMPDPGQLVKKLEGLAAQAVALPPSAPGEPAQAPATPAMEWRQLVEHVEHYSIPMGAMMRGQVRVVELSPARLVFEQAPGFAMNIVEDLRKILREVTGDLWEVEQRSEGGQPTLMEVEAKAREAQVSQRQQSPLMQAALAAFPGAQDITDEGQSGGFARRQSYGSR
ncbi:DNA polymerase III subunit gamma/tau [Novosphingobium sp. SG707]|uniref:DNA polymerase III subunit gamma/tau n=1 Tax=Novosphingobium sp. SG707 TaxID=2586996 RepID=UPI0014473344|nr:DNA polymerase III subunit gamma/tau [Novosphingobium sp. SG707]NKJ01523.1 DNA polymerase-3 subunit gamma/tau [Novosphingobium sp. SG707]